MRVVLYADDMEPITVLELPEFAVSHLVKHHRVRLAVPVPFSLTPAPAAIEPLPPIVEIWAERFIRNGHEHTFLFTRNEEAAMMLRSELLPGQRKDAQERERGAYARGFLQAIIAASGRD